MINEPIIFITGNEEKLKEVKRYITVPIEHKKLDLVEIQSLDVYEVVEHKVREAYKQLHKPVLVEDVSFILPALGKLPGTLIKWFLQELGNEGLCALMKNYQDKTAITTVLYGFYDGIKAHFFEGTIAGKITDAPVGDYNFGWGKIFIPDGSTKTLAQMPPEEQERVAYRLIALKKFETFLEKYNQLI